MSTRIRYIEDKMRKRLISMRKFKSEKNGAEYRVVLNLEDMTYGIKNLNKEMFVKSTKKDNKKPPKHLHTLKRQAKKALESLGVRFSRELRGIDGRLEYVKRILSEGPTESKF